jgi:potassium-dependent mechanosensitive channel
LRLFISLLLLLLTFPDALNAAPSAASLLNPDSQASFKNETKIGNKQKAPPEAQSPAFPDLSEVSPRASELLLKAADTRKIISDTMKILSRKNEIDAFEAHQEKLRNMIIIISSPNNWDATQIYDANIVLMKENKRLQDLVVEISSELADLESNRSEWEKRKIYWRDWSVFLNADANKTLKEAFDAAHETIKKALEDLTGAVTGIFAFQERTSRLLDENIRLVQIVKTAFSDQRSNIFKKTGYSFFSAEFYARFNTFFWLSLWNNFGNFDNSFDSSSLLLVATRILIVFICVFLVLSMRGIPKLRQERPFLLSHPWALGVFLAEIIPIIFFDPPTGLARDLTWTLLVFSASILVWGSMNIRLRAPVICFLAALVAVPGLLKMVPLPDPLFRIYWAGTTVTGMFLFLRWERQLRSRVLQRKWFFSGFMRVGAFVTALATVSQAAGFVNLFEALYITSLRVVFIITALNLFLQINSTSMLLLEHSLIANMAFISRYGKELAAKLESIVKIALWGLAFFSLLPIIGFYSSTRQAFETLFLSKVTIGTLSMSPMLVLMAILVLYLSSFISWIFRGILESEVFPHMQVDRGAGQSVTKLLHYFLILIGVLFSMGVLGIDLKSFAVMGGALGVGIGFGMQDIVNNFISGLILLFERPIRVGDRIDAGSQIGIVKKIGLRSTIVETLDQAELIIPNSKLVSEKVTNWTHSGTIARLKISVGVAYGSDMDLVSDMLIEAALSNPHVLKDPEPVALLKEFGDSSLNLELHVWLSDVNTSRFAQSEISREILRRFDEAGIEIPFPQRDVRLRHPEEVDAIGKEYTDAGEQNGADAGGLALQTK